MKYRAYLYPTALILAFFLCWEFLARLELINTGLFPPPLVILEDLNDLFKQEVLGQSVLLTHLTTTLKRLFFAAIEGTLVGFVVGVCMGLSYRFYRFFDPIITESAQEG